MTSDFHDVRPTTLRGSPSDVADGCWHHHPWSPGPEEGNCWMKAHEELPKTSLSYGTSCTLTWLRPKTTSMHVKICSWCWLGSELFNGGWNREYLVPQIRSINNRIHSEAKIPRSYDYPVANHIATNKSSANHEMTCFRAFTLLLGIFGKCSRQGF